MDEIDKARSKGSFLDNIKEINNNFDKGVEEIFKEIINDLNKKYDTQNYLSNFHETRKTDFLKEKS